MAGSAFRVVDVIAFILATPVQFIFGYRFYRGTFYAIRRRRADMNVLIALGTTVAYGFSVIVLVVNTIQVRNGLTATDEKPAFETAALLITIVLFGKWMEALAKKQTAAGVEALANLAPRDVRLVSPPPRVADLFDKGVHAELVSVGDYFRVSASGVFPLDAMLVVGDTLVDEAMLTGESWPVAKQPGDTVYAGTVNGRNSVVVCCKAESSDTMLEQIVRLVKRAQDARAPIEAFADKLSAWFVPVVLSIAVCSTVVWFVLAQTNSIPAGWLKGEGNVLFAILFGLAVLVIACPCALGLATPTVIMVATSIGATRLGILYKDGGEALQAAHNVHTVLFDKTGTLTVGKPSVTATASFDIDVESKELINVKPEESMHDVSVAGRTLEYMAAAESQCDHPISQAIIQYAEEKSGVAWKAIKVRKHKELAGKGIRCVVEGNRTVVIGKAEWVLSQEGYAGGAGVRMSIACERMLSMWENAGRTVVFGHVSGEQMIGFGVEDAVRPESARVVAFLQSNGIRCGMITGDGIGTAKSVAKVVGIKEDYIRARALPGDKVEAVKWFSTDKEGESRKAKQTAGGVVFIGDGINDAGALSAATVGIAMGCGSEIAAESAGIVLVKCNLWGVVVALDLARVAFRRIKGNYVWALGFNSLGIPLAAGAAYPVLEKRIPPYAAAAAMALSSVIVVMSSLALRLYQSPKEYQQSPKVTRTS